MNYTEAEKLTDSLLFLKTDHLTFQKPVKIKKDKKIMLDERIEPPVYSKEEILKLLINTELDETEEEETLIKESLNTLECELKKEDTEEIPIYIINEYATKRSTKPMSVFPFVYEKDIRWALRPKGCTILKINYSLVRVNDPIFFQAIKATYDNLKVKDGMTEQVFMKKIINDLKGIKYDF